MTVIDDLQPFDPQVVHGVIAKPFDNDAVVGLVMEILGLALPLKRSPAKLVRKENS